MKTVPRAAARARASPRAKSPRARRSASAPPLLGAHVSTAGGVPMAITRAYSIGCTAVQLFVKNNMQWFAAAPFGIQELREFHEHENRAAVKTVFGHSGYMINLAATNPQFLAKSRQALEEELRRADQLELPFLVLHPGAHMGAGIEAGLHRVIESLDAVFAKAESITTRVALEITAGQGSCLGCTFEQLDFILRGVREPERLCVCLDTAHLFAAGYDLRTFQATESVFAAFDTIIGKKHLAALHLNDSKTPFGSKVDRHEHIGKGQIGLEAFRYIMSAPRFAQIPKVLETPKGKEMIEDVENLRTLKELRVKR
jgi:deoxyribonuclease-4